MSADGTNACPSCYQQATGTPIAEITQADHLNSADIVGIADDGLWEYFENYIDRGHVVFEYQGGYCDTCGYDIPPFTIRHPIPEGKP